MAISKRGMKFLAFFIIHIIIVVYLFDRYQNEIISGIQALAIKIRSLRGGVLLLMAITTICSVPPFIGFDFSITLMGFTYGFPRGCIPATLAATLGSTVVFWLVRHLKLSRLIKLSENNQERFKAIQLAIKQEGFKMIVLLRICPLPWQLSNLFLSLCETIDFKLYLITSFIGALRFNLDVWFGSQLANLSDPDVPDQVRQTSKIAMGSGIIILAGVSYWLYKITMRKIKENQSTLPEQESTSLLGHQSEPSSLV